MGKQKKSYDKEIKNNENFKKCRNRERKYIFIEKLMGFK